MRRRAYPVAITLLLLGGGLAVGGLFLQWMHLTQCDGSPLPYPSGTTPAVTFGLGGVNIWPLLVVA